MHVDTYVIVSAFSWMASMALITFIGYCEMKNICVRLIKLNSRT